MPRANRHFLPGHKLDLGSNRELCSYDKDRRRFSATPTTRLIWKGSAVIKSDWKWWFRPNCLMPNHVHPLVERGSQSLSRFMQRLQQSYTRSRLCSYASSRAQATMTPAILSSSIPSDAVLNEVLAGHKVISAKASVTHLWSFSDVDPETPTPPMSSPLVMRGAPPGTTQNSPGYKAEVSIM